MGFFRPLDVPQSKKKTHKHQDFHVLDVDGDGVLNSVELEQGLQWLGMGGNNQTLGWYTTLLPGLPGSSPLNNRVYSHFIGGYKLTILPGTMQTWSNELATENTTFFGAFRFREMGPRGISGKSRSRWNIITWSAMLDPYKPLFSTATANNWWPVDPRYTKMVWRLVEVDD